MNKIRRGFTIMEVLLALSIGGLVLVTATSLLVTISQAWAKRPATRDFFDAHVNGVADFLSSVLDQAGISTQAQKRGSLVELKAPFDDFEDPLISFYLPEAPIPFFSPHGKSVRVHAHLYPEDDGLSFLWFSELQELEMNGQGNLQPLEEEDLRKTMISPFFREIYYCYYGEENAGPDDVKEWVIDDRLEDSAQSDGFRIPSFVILVFRWEEQDLEKTISLPLERLAPSGIEPEPR